MVLELPVSVGVPPFVALDREFDHHDVDDHLDGYAPVVSFGTLGQERLVHELLAVVSASIALLRPRHRRLIPRRISDGYRRSATRETP
jgi:hypothetical protein